jgi:hypothetical protein
VTAADGSGVQYLVKVRITLDHRAAVLAHAKRDSRLRQRPPQLANEWRREHDVTKAARLENQDSRARQLLQTDGRAK